MIWRDVQKAIDDFVTQHPGQESGPAHILLSDGNVADSHILFCLRETWKSIHDGGTYHGGEWQSELSELWDVFNFLLYLSKIPEDVREEPDDEDGSVAQLSAATAPMPDPREQKAINANRLLDDYGR